MQKQTLGEFIATLRKANGYTQQDVSERLNISNRTLSSWETDRTAPDLLVLPLLADLYGVTVEEILRAERITKNTADEKISENALRARRKHGYGKFVAKQRLFCTFSLLSATLFVVSSCLFLFLNLPFWCNVFLNILSLACTAVFCALSFYNAHQLACSEGVFRDDTADSDKPFVLALHNKLATALLLISLPFLLGGWVLGSVFWATKSNGAIVIYAVLNSVLGVGLFASSLVIANKSIPKYGSEKQRTAHKTNKKLSLKICGFCAIPIALTVTCSLLSSFCAKVTTTLFETQDTQQLENFFHTYTVEDASFCKLYGVPEGEYLLNFPQTELPLSEDSTETEFYNLGNNFWGKAGYVKTVGEQSDQEFSLCLSKPVFAFDNQATNARYNIVWDLYYNSTPQAETQNLQFLQRLNVCHIVVADGDSLFYRQLVNARSLALEYEVEKFWGTQHCRTYIDVNGNNFGVYCTKTNNFGVGLTVVASTVIEITAGVGLAVYLSKRKKQVYKF